MGSTVSWLGDEAVLAGRARSDPQAFGELYRRHFVSLYNYVRYRVGDAATADDVTAQVFERALAKLDTYDPDRGRFVAWLFAIARNRVNSHLARRRRWRWLSLDQVRHPVSPGPPQEQEAIQRQDRDRLLEAMAQLRSREREILGLRFAAGLTNREIAALIELKETHVGVILFRSIRRLRSALEEK